MLPRPPKGVVFGIRAVWGLECTSTLIHLRGIEMRGEFDVSKGKHMENGWQKVRSAMCTKLGESAPWFVKGGNSFHNFCKEHNVDEELYLEETFKLKASDKWKYLQEVYKEKKRGTVTEVDENGKVVKKKANCTGEQRLDEVDWPFFGDMQQAMQHRPSVIPPADIIMENCDTNTKYDTCVASPPDLGMDARFLDPHLQDIDETLKMAQLGKDGKKRKSDRVDEASSPKSKPANLLSKGRRPSNVDRRHEEVLSTMMEQSGTVNETVTNVSKCITAMQQQLQSGDREAQILDRALKIQRSWDERFTFLIAQEIPREVILDRIGRRPTAVEAIQEVRTLQEALRQSC